jgi:hypothetical protein
VLTGRESHIHEHGGWLTSAAFVQLFSQLLTAYRYEIMNNGETKAPFPVTLGVLSNKLFLKVQDHAKNGRKWILCLQYHITWWPTVAKQIL